jgi:hypothetical protein
MDDRTRKRLEATGARVTTVKEFLDLGDSDMTFIEMKIALVKLEVQHQSQAGLEPAEK